VKCHIFVSKVRTNQGDIDKCLDSDCDEASEDPYYEPNWCLNRKLTSPLGPTRPLVYFERLNAEQCTLDVCQRKGCGIGKEEGRDYCYKRKTMIPMIHTYQYRRSLQVAATLGTHFSSVGFVRTCGTHRNSIHSSCFHGSIRSHFTFQKCIQVLGIFMCGRK
jgi:hypothetical protein